MKKKSVLRLVLLPAIALLFAIFGIGCTNQPSNEQHCECSFCNEQPYETFLYERNFPNFVETYDRTVIFDYDELLDAFNFIVDYWEMNPYCAMRNAMFFLVMDVQFNRVRVGFYNESEDVKVAFRTHVLDSPAIALVGRGGSGGGVRGHMLRFNRFIYFGTEANRPTGDLLYNGQQAQFTFAELRDTMTLVADFMWAGEADQAFEIIGNILLLTLDVTINRVEVRLRHLSEEFEDAFRANVTDSHAILFVDLGIR